MTNEVTLVEKPLFPRLTVKAGGRVIKEIELKGDLTIGRAEDNDLELLDPKVSRHHARIKLEGGTFILSDLGSANGTQVNGVRITEAHILRHGERIGIGDAELLYQEPGKSVQDTVPSIQPPPAVGATQLGPAAAARGKGRGTGLVIGLLLVGAVLLLAAVAVGVYLLAPGVYEQIGLISPASPTPAPVEAASPTPTSEAVGTPVESAPTTVPVGTPAGGEEQEIDDLLLQAEALTRRSKFEDAIAIYDDLARRRPEDARPQIGWAWALIYDDEAPEALPHAERAVELEPMNTAAQAVLARAYIETGDLDRALTTARQAVELDAGSALAHAVLADAYRANGQIQAAVDEADLALVQDINNAEAHRSRGWLYHVAENDMGRAAGELQIAAGLEPELWLRRHELGLLLYEAEDYTTAILAFQDALGIRPEAVTYTAIGRAYYDLGQYDQAKASFQQAVAAGAEDADTLGGLAASLAQQGRCDEAQPYYEQALALDAHHPLAGEARDICAGAAPTSTPSPTTKAATPGGGGTPQATPKPTKKPAPAAAIKGRIAFPVWDPQNRAYDTYIAQAKDGSGRQLVVSQMHQPALSPDGSWLAVNGEQSDHMNLFIVRPNGSELREITDFIEDGLPCWSPDGKSLVFSSTRHGDKQSRVYIIDEVPFTGGKVKGRPLNFGPDDVRGEYPTWTADNQIVYSGCDLTVAPAPCGLFIMSAAPGPQSFKQLTDIKNDTAPAAYGDKIAFMSDRDGNWEIYVIHTDGSGLKRLTKNAAIDGLPTWSPDGKTLAFVSNQGGAWAIWAMNPDGSRRRKLFEIGGGGLAFDWQHERISWSR